MNFKIIFHLDGTGLVYDPYEPIHIDALLAWCLAPIHGKITGLQRSDVPEDIPLPLMKEHINGTWVWQASALFPEGPSTESLRYWRKRFRQNRVELTEGSPNLQMGKYRDYNMPLPILHTLKMVGYASGNGKEVKKLLKKIKYLGKKRAYGLGGVVNVEIESTKENYSLCKDGNAMRWMPREDGTRLVRPRPPYWHPIGRVLCCEVGDGC